MYVSPATVKADPVSLRLWNFNQVNDEADVAFCSGIFGMSLYTCTLNQCSSFLIRPDAIHCIDPYLLPCYTAAVITLMGELPLSR